MVFQVPESSSPPSTPDRRSSHGSNLFSFGASNNPSTTPAGPPPPSSAGSFTPAGPPPSSVFGSSMLNGPSPIKPLSFSQQSSFGNNSPNSKFMSSAAAPRRSGLSHRYDASDDDGEGEEEEGYLDEQYDDQDPRYNEEEGGSEEGDEAMDDYESGMPRRSDIDDYEDRTGSDLMLATSGALKRSRAGMDVSFAQSSSEPKTSMFEGIAKGLYKAMPAPAANEDDSVILDTEAIVSRLYEGVGTQDEVSLVQAAMDMVPNELLNIWEEYDQKTMVPGSEEYATCIGPGPTATRFSKANFIASLALQIRHPVTVSDYSIRKVVPLPQVVLRWMNNFHNPYPAQLEDLRSHQPSPSSSELFWDTLFNLLIRGKVAEVANLLQDAGWQHARNETDAPRTAFSPVGFSGAALNNIERVVSTAVQTLKYCPAVSGDWDINSSDWTLFRTRATSALEDLRRFAEGHDGKGHGESIAHGGVYSKTAQKAESKVPWQIYQNLVTMYSIVAGDRTAIITSSEDWLEATFGLLVWWDEGKEDRRLAFGRSAYRASSRENDEVALRRKLRRSFRLATTESEYAVNSADEVEVALASLFEEDYVSVVGILRGLSGPISAAVAEVASIGGWLPQAEEKSLINMGSDLDQDDLDLLGINASPSKADGAKDQTLIAYAQSLSNKGELRATSRFGTAAFGAPQVVREGWELAIALLGRLESGQRSEQMVGDFLESFDLDSTASVDKLWSLLNGIGLTNQAELVAESYANSLAERSHNYGTALWYYALSHKTQKVKDVLDLLISFSLVQSTAFPPESELDEHLQRLIMSPNAALTDLSKMDHDAATLLHKSLSGYATLRKFYDLRDGNVRSINQASKGQKANKFEAASSLIAVIASSDDNIRGGLYDEGRGAVVSVDFLLALLGEALVFINQSDFALTVSQIDTLLKSIEDVQTVGPRVYSACSEFLQTVVASGQGLKGSTPADMLRKSTSNLSGTSSFSMVGSSMLASQLKQSMSSSGVLVKGNVKRGWDWRRGISAGTTGEDLLRILRLGLANSLASAWLLEADGRM